MSPFSPRHYWLALFMAVAFYCYEFFLRMAPSVVVPELMQHYGILGLQIGEMAFFYYAIYGLAQLPAGLILDHYSMRWVLTLATLACAVGTVLFVITRQFYVANIARMIIGAASAFSFIGVLTIISHHLPKKWFTTAVGVAVSVGTLAASYVDVITSFLVDKAGWVNTFYYSALLGVVVALLIFIVFSWVKNPLVTRAVSYPEQNLWQEIKKLLRDYQVWKNAIIGGLLYIPSTVIATVWGVAFLESAYQLTKVQATSCISLLFWGWVVGSPIVTFLCDHYKCEKLMVLWGGLILTMLTIVIIYQPTLVYRWIYFMMFLFGFFSCCQLVIWRIFREIVPIARSGWGAALTNMIITLTTALSPFLVGAILDMRRGAEQAIGHYIIGDYQVALLILPFSLGMALLWFFWPLGLSQLYVTGGEENGKNS